MMPRLKSMGEGRPCVGGEPVFSELQNYPWSDWPDGKLRKVIFYLRGNLNLELPNEWKACFPTKI